MSLGSQDIDTAKILDPTADVKKGFVYPILSSGNRHTYKTFTSQSSSESSFVFNAPPPSQNIIVDRLIYLKVPVTVDLTGTAGDNLDKLYISNYHAFRSYPLSSVMSTLEVTLNDSSVSINMSDVIKPLLQYHNNSRNLGERIQSMTPTLMDQSQQYSDLQDSARNPLGSFVDSEDGAYTGRGGFPVTISNNTATSATISATITEPLMISPLVFGCDEQQPGFIGLRTFDLTANFGSDLSRIWSYDSDNGGTLTDISVSFGTPQLLFHYITPPQYMSIPKTVRYPFLSIERYPTTLTNTEIESGESTTISSSNINLNSIPRIIYLFVRKNNSDLTAADTDSYFSIEGVKVNWNNNAGLLSEASKERLYYISAKNGVNMSWNQWSGEPTPYISNDSDLSISGVGSVLALEFGTDIGLRDDEAPGMLGNFQLQIDIDCTNQSDEAIIPSFYIVTHSEGIFSIEDGSCRKQIGVVSHNDVMNAKRKAGMNYNHLKYMSGSAINWRNLMEKAKRVYSSVSPKLSEIRNCANLGREVIRDIRGNNKKSSAAKKDAGKMIKPARRKYTKRKTR